MQYTIAGSLCGRQRLQLVGLCMLTEIEKLLLMCAVRTRQLGGMHAVSVASHYGRAPCAWLTPESMLQSESCCGAGFVTHMQVQHCYPLLTG